MQRPVKRNVPIYTVVLVIVTLLLDVTRENLPIINFYADVKIVLIIPVALLSLRLFFAGEMDDEELIG